MTKPHTLGRIGRTLAIASLGALTLTTVALGDVAEAANKHEKGRGATVRAPKAEWKSIDREARKKGRVDVIVHLNVAATSESKLSKNGKRRQRSAIAEHSKRLARFMGGRKKNRFRGVAGVPFVTMRVQAARLDKLRKAPGVAAVTLDHFIKVDLASDRRPPKQVKTVRVAGPTGSAAVTTDFGGRSQQLNNWWHEDRIGIRNSRQAGWNGRGGSIAIVDTGVDSSHPGLRGRVWENGAACFTTGSFSCPNGNWWQYGAGAARPCGFHWDCYHGTHVAHIAAGARGVAPRAWTIPIQVFERMNGAPGLYTSSLAYALWYVSHTHRAYNISVVNMSVGTEGWVAGATCDDWGDSSYQGQSWNYVASMIKWLRQQGVATVVAAGNDGSHQGVSFPACASNAIVVGNSTVTRSGTDAVFSGSNSNWLVDLWAPGTDICSAVPSYFEDDLIQLGYDRKLDGYTCGDYGTGTSMAAPQVAGAIAVLHQKRPQASVTTKLNALKASGPRIVDTRNNVKRTRINVAKALRQLQ